MNGTTDVDFEQLSEMLASGVVIPAAQLRELALSRDLIGLGMLAADVRARRVGTHGTFVRVQELDVASIPDGIGGLGFEVEPTTGTFVMGELRLTGRAASLDVACTVVAACVAQADVPVSGWSLDDLSALGP
ncbi:MAG TPA: hypothetical protein VMF13_23935, partial [Luteitalea sp.]|nr:hypothetical protein [Luteitalea sp.]